MKNTLLALLFAGSLFSMPVMADNDGKVDEKVAVSAEMSAATTTIQGKVTDMITGESLAGAEVTIEGTDIKAFTDLDGNFSIAGLKPGKYSIICSLISYNKSLVENLNIVGVEVNSCEIALEASR